MASSVTQAIVVNNVAPIVAVAASEAILEGGTFSSSGAFVDPGADSWTATVDYGDGSSPMPLALNGKSFTLEHGYAAPGIYAVTVTVWDGDNSGLGTSQVVVANVPPAVGPFPGATILEGETYVSSGAFTDPGASSWTATVTYGDGTDMAPLGLSGHGFSLEHRFERAGSFVVSVTVSDGIGTGTNSALVEVQTPAEGVADLIGRVRQLIATGELSQRRGERLIDALDSAARQLRHDHWRGATEDLHDFADEIRHLERKGAVDGPEAASLFAFADRLVLSLSGRRPN